MPGGVPASSLTMGSSLIEEEKNAGSHQISIFSDQRDLAGGSLAKLKESRKRAKLSRNHVVGQVQGLSAAAQYATADNIISSDARGKAPSRESDVTNDAQPFEQGATLQNSSDRM